MGILETVAALGKKLAPGGLSRAKPEVVDKGYLIQKIRESSLFKDLAEDTLETVFAHMETLSVPEGRVIVREDSEGDYYYLLVEGTAKVMRHTAEEGGSKCLAVIDEPVGFGEEALISNQKRNASVVMSSPGKVMRMSKDVFNDYVKKPLVKWLFAGEALDKIKAGASWIDVRDPSEIKTEPLLGAIMIPLDSIRERSNELDPDQEYICYCKNGRLSSTAAFLLRQRGLNAGVLRGGLKALKNG